MKNINMKIRFSKDNVTFIVRFVLALLVPVLTYFNLETKDITSWSALINLIVEFLKNPYLVGLVVINAINLIPDPTTKGIIDSELAMTYKEPKGGK